MENKFVIHSRNEKETHVVVEIKGAKAKEIARVIRAALRESEYRRDLSYHITIQS